MRLNARVLLVVVMAGCPMAAQAQTGTLADASIVAWGDNRYGHCNVPSGYNFTQIANGLAIRSDGTLVTWGNYAIAPPAGNDYTQIAVGAYHELALRSNGSIVAWGDNTYGQCNVPSGTFVQIGAGGYHTLGIKSDGSLVAWGYNGLGQCTVPAGTYAKVSGGYQGTAAIRSDGTLAVWGAGASDYSIPSGNNFVQLSANSSGHTLALRSDGSLAAWGYENHGQVSLTPSGNNFIGVTPGGYHSLAVRSDGTLAAWGYDGFGQVSNTPTSGYYLAVAAGGHNSLALRARDLYDADLTVTGTGSSATLNRPINVAGNASIQTTMSMANNPTMTVAGMVNLNDTGKIVGAGTIAGRVLGTSNSIITATGNLVLGDSTSFEGFDTSGKVEVGANTVTLNSNGFANLGRLTTMSGGTLSAANGVSFGVGRNLSGSGIVNAKIAAGFGSTINATGNLTLGKANAYDGFFSDGVLLTGTNTVTIHDRNDAVLGSLTQLGNGTNGGTLTAGTANPSDTYAHFLVESGKNLVGRGTINGNFKNQGHVIGDGTGLGQQLVFSSLWKVSGTGTFENTLIQGTFSPGESPAIVNGTNQGFSGKVEIELGGITPGFGNGYYDQINDSATMLLSGSPTLSILPWDTFVPEIGDRFEIMTWTSSLGGAFSNIQVDPWFATHGILFDVKYNNVGGAGNLMLTAVPEPSTIVLLGIGAASLLCFGWWRRRRCG